jgi:membrane-bound lytic murein transglycosylase D
MSQRINIYNMFIYAMSKRIKFASIFKHSKTQPMATKLSTASKAILFSMIISASSLSVHANNMPVSEDSDVQYCGFLSNLDSMLNLWYVMHVPELASTRYESYRQGDTAPVVFTDEQYLERIKAMNSVISLSYNSRVQAYINLYSMRRREQVESMLGLSEYYFPIFEEILEEVGVPQELKYLAVIESALNPRARSRAGAVGIWQFMYATGKIYGLHVDSYIDQRQDPILATYASARFMKDLHNMFGDWVLALAAYNCGPGNVRKAIARSGGKRNYWDIYNFLPRETRGYVPAFIAAMYVMEHHKDHNLYVKPSSMPWAIDTVKVHDRLHLQQVADVMDIPLQMLRDLNPQYRRDIVPASPRGHALILPANYAESFIVLQDSIHSHNADKLFNLAEINKSPSSGSAPVSAAQPPGTNRVTYTVRSGDNLGLIASNHGVTVSQLRAWNGISGTMIRAGQRLVIYTPASRASAKQVHEPVSASVQGGYVVYTVKQGDTLWNISRQFPGVTENDIMRLNNISNARSLAAGQQIKIMKKQ